MLTRLLAVPVVLALAVSSMAGCRAEAEVDPDGRVRNHPPAAR